ncbi:GGDEF domain-containing protein [Janthinobacterium sp. FW305-129]|uniref:GGDEF domain-containing protein n=1 Tax=Janthinobacterium sp. FW305-129 TaxID=2775054 RepID=UPI001E3F623D|nr:GGDEF domain-containing protein [Janthinobacterium sp. FW305-129]
MSKKTTIQTRPAGAVQRPPAAAAPPSPDAAKMEHPPAARPLPGLLKKLGTMTAIRDMQLVEKSLLRTLGPMLGVLQTSLYRTDENRDVVRVLRHSRSSGPTTDGTERITEQVEEVRSGAHVPPHVAQLLADMRLLGRSCSRALESHLMIGYPLHGGNELCGYLIFERSHAVTPVEDAVIHGVLEVFSNYYALLDTSQRDRLTGLRNRHSLELNLERLWDELAAQSGDAAEVPETYWLALLDIDHFKRINDNYGHMIGDEVLLLVARLLDGAFRSSDLLYRYGGEEFIAVIAASDLEQATLAFERARLTIAQFNFPRVGAVTISGGFCLASSAVLANAIVSRADQTLYEAKRAGRNRILHYGSLVDAGILTEVEAGTIELF